MEASLYLFAPIAGYGTASHHGRRPIGRTQAILPTNRLFSIQLYTLFQICQIGPKGVGSQMSEYGILQLQSRRIWYIMLIELE